MLPWIAGAVGIAVLIVVVFMLRGGEDEDALAQTPPPPPPTTSNSASQAPEPPGSPNIPEPAETLDRAEAAAELETDLQAKRLWSEVEVDPGNDTVMVIRSAYCSDAGLKDSIGRLQARMSSYGLKKVECYERHGSLVFEQAL